jgi:hypothetical protein
MLAQLLAAVASGGGAQHARTSVEIFERLGAPRAQVRATLAQIAAMERMTAVSRPRHPGRLIVAWQDGGRDPDQRKVAHPVAN